MIWKEAVVAYFRELFLHLPGTNWWNNPPAIVGIWADIGNQHFLNMKSNTCPLPQIFVKRKIKLKKEEIHQILTRQITMIFKCGTTYVSLQTHNSMVNVKIFLNSFDVNL
jgi:TusA-related sulfurtransferase